MCNWLGEKRINNGPCLPLNPQNFFPNPERNKFRCIWNHTKIQVNQNVEDKLYLMLAVLMKITKEERLG